jgi:hypothetical protein
MVVQHGFPVFKNVSTRFVIFQLFPWYQNAKLSTNWQNGPRWFSTVFRWFSTVCGGSARFAGGSARFAGGSARFAGGSARFAVVQHGSPVVQHGLPWFSMVRVVVCRSYRPKSKFQLTSIRYIKQPHESRTAQLIKSPAQT